MGPAAIAGLAALLLATALPCGAAALGVLRRRRAVRDRLRALRAPARAAAPAAPSMLVAPPAASPLMGRLLRLLGYDPNAVAERRLGWPLVALAGAAAAAGAMLRLPEMVGLPAAVPLSLLAGALTVRTIFAWQHRRYCDAVFQQIPDALGLMVRAIRAGLPLAEALRGISREMASPTREEFARVVGDVAIGRPVEEALMRLHERTGLTEYAFLAVTLGLQSQTGGSLAETLDNLADMVRKRVAMAKRAKALAAEGRMQAGMLVVLPFVAAAVMSTLQPFYIETFTQNPTGQRMAMVGLGLMLLGLLTIRWLIRQAGRD
ncbi:type II secretion system F family protein [Falsiroseomonas sp. CW058]|uniref:type II secretion system F family protein n=1 Tax=Falsiroseomonas sp. CW058 TaxID=3388664 RepID=UPI003D324246